MASGQVIYYARVRDFMYWIACTVQQIPEIQRVARCDEDFVCPRACAYTRFVYQVNGGIRIVDIEGRWP